MKPSQKKENVHIPFPPSIQNEASLCARVPRPAGVQKCYHSFLVTQGRVHIPIKARYGKYAIRNTDLPEPHGYENSVLEKQGTNVAG
jgi:hypothetical protein